MARSALLMAGASAIRQGRRVDTASCWHQVRGLSLHEFQSQNILHRFGLPVPRGKVARCPSEAAAIARELGSQCQLKPQVLGETRPAFLKREDVASDAAATDWMAAGLFALNQTQNHQPIDFVYVEEAVKHDGHWDLTLGIDKENCCPQLVLQRQSLPGTTETDYKRVFKLAISEGIPSPVATEICSFIELPTDSSKNMSTILGQLYQVFIEKDVIELRVTLLHSADTGNIVCSSAELIIDDAASKRQPELFSMRDINSEVPEELEAEAAGLVYVKMDGSIGNVVNGAGLAMATNDAIASYGGTSSNFLDTGGQATVETMQKAFGIILRDPRVKTILVNIYGGIIRCDMIAASIISTAEKLGPMQVPIVVRLQGTNSEEGLELLKKADLGLHVESDFGRAAARAVELADHQQVNSSTTSPRT